MEPEERVEFGRQLQDLSLQQSHDLPDFDTNTDTGEDHFQNADYLSRTTARIPFDEAIGHYPRYDRRELSRIMPEDLECTRSRYLDCVGLLASLVNRLVLKSQMPSKKQITLWDKGMIESTQE
jgi:hypothetical protein